MQYRIYFNATKRVFSVQQKTAKGWRVVGHYTNILAKNATTKVSQKVRQRVIAEKKKYVHAWIYTDDLTILTRDNRTHLTAIAGIAHSNIKVTYNPFKHLQFMMDIDGELTELDNMPHDMLLDVYTSQVTSGKPRISLLN